MLKIIKNVLVYRDQEWKQSELLICDHRIAEVAERIDCSYHEMTVIDGKGMYAIPGLIDQHVHITGGGGEGGFSNEVAPIQPSTLVRAGITTVVGLLGTDGTTRSVESVVAKAKALREEGLSAYCLTGAYEYPSPTVTGSVRRDIMMIDEIIGVKVALADHRSSQITFEELARLASDAWQAGILSGKPGIVHIHTGSGKDQLDLLFELAEKTNIPITAFRPTHLSNKVEAAIRFASLGGYVDFTAVEDQAETAEILSRVLKEVPLELVTLSSDGNGSAPIWNEKKEMVGIGVGKVSKLWETVAALIEQEGVPLEKAMMLCTENAAKALKLWPQKGTLEKNSDADIVLVDRELRIDTVMAAGQVMLRHGAVTVPFKFESL